MPAIMYVCDQCAVDAPESCGHYERGYLRVIPSGEWLCEGCYDEWDRNDHRLAWKDYPLPPKYGPKEAA